ncbi:MAG: Trk system potassium transporter TrkA [Gemmatimonadota bacterium]
MRVVIVGAGEVGMHVAERLSKERHDVVIVEVDPDRLDYVESHLDVAVLEGSGTSLAVLERAGIAEAKILLAVTSIDEVNLVSCMSARGAKGLVRVARVSNPDFYGHGTDLQPERFGVDLLINPERELALETLRLLQSTAATDVAVFADGRVQLIGLLVQEGAPALGRPLRDISAEEGGRQFLTVAMEREGATVVPDGSTILSPGDHVYFVAAAPDIPRALELCGYELTKLKRVMIGGGSLEAFYLAQLLEQHRVQATLLVPERERGEELAEKLPRNLVLQGSVTEVELLELEGVGHADAFVAVTEEDETNILASLVAKHAGARQVITLVNRVDFVPLARRIGLDTTVSPRLSAANAILRYVRRGSVMRVATLRDSEAEAIAFRVSPECPAAGRPLAEVDFPANSLVAAIVRGNDVLVPRGSDTLQAGDTAVVFALPDAIADITRLFPT